MSRTNVDIDDEACAQVMRDFARLAPVIELPQAAGSLVLA